MCLRLCADLSPDLFNPWNTEGCTDLREFEMHFRYPSGFICRQLS